MSRLKKHAYLIAAGAAILVLIPSTASASVSGAIVEATGSIKTPHRFDGTISTTCTSSAGCNGKIELIARPRMAKITRPAKWKCTSHKHYVTCRVVKPAKAVFTQCAPRLSADPELWNREKVTEWEKKILEGFKFVTKDPPITFAYVETGSEPIPGGYHETEFTGTLLYGSVEPCLYLIKRKTVAVVKEGCLPELSQEVREELCAKEHLSSVETLAKGMVSFGK